MKSKLKRALCAIFCLALAAALVPPPEAEAATPKYMVVEQALQMALVSDAKIKKKYNQILIKRMKYTEAVSAIIAKAKNMRSFRWSPILTFKLPQKLDLVTEYNLSAKPQALMAEIIALQHELNDLEFALKDTVNILFTDIYILQEQIAFSEQLLQAYTLELERAMAKLPLGTAKQADVDTTQKGLDALVSDLALQKRKFETAKAELADITRLDVTTGYIFKNPLKTAEISRRQLEDLVDYTLANDHTFYMAKSDEALALLAFDTYEQLFRKNYGAKVNIISVFLSQARQGSEVDTTAFKTQYDLMLKSFDAPWDKSIKILFFTFTMEWLKFERSGTRYIEDEEYALYSAPLEYLSARKDRESAEKALRKQIAAEYESLVTAKNSLDALLGILKQSKADLEKLLTLNKLGKAEFSEVKDKQEDYLSLQNDAVAALAEYYELLSAFDRLTCGAVSKLLRGEGLDSDTGGIIDSNAELPYYYIYTDIADMVFVFGIDIPEDYEPAIDSFEIWYEGTKIGEKTPADKSLRHLTLDYGETSMLTVRLFDGDDFVDQCEIDVSIPRDVLPLSGQTKPPAVERVVGRYTITTAAMGKVSMSTLKLTMERDAGASFYKLSSGGADLFTGEIKPVGEVFTYLTLMVPSIESVTVTFYDKDRQPVYTGRFNTDDGTIRQIPAG